MFSTISTPVSLAIAAAVGLLVGLLISSFFNREPKSDSDNLLPDKYVKDGYTEAARLFYSPATKTTITFLDGDFYESFLSLTPEQKKRVLRLAGSWSDWSGVIPEKPADNE
jgi:hypothetical protein